MKAKISSPLCGEQDTTPVAKQLYRVSQPAILFVTGEAADPQEVIDAFNQMLNALDTIKSPAMNVVRVGDCATTMIVEGE